MQAVIGAGLVMAAIPILWFVLAGDRGSVRLAQQNLRRGQAEKRGPVTTPTGQRLADDLGDTLTGLGRKFTPVGRLDHLENRLLAAGLGNTWTLDRVLAVKVVLFVLPVAYGLLQILTGGSVLWLVLGAAAGALLFWIPDLQIGGKARQREERIELQLPDVTDQITVSVEAGLGFDAALQRVVASTEGPLIDEFERVLQDIRLGFPRNDALQALAARTEVQDLRLFIAAVTQASSYGISIANVLRSQSAELREKRKFRAEEQAQKIPVKIVVPLILCILPVLFIIMIGPGVLRIADTGFGG